MFSNHPHSSINNIYNFSITYKYHLYKHLIIRAPIQILVELPNLILPLRSSLTNIDACLLPVRYDWINEIKTGTNHKFINFANNNECLTQSKALEKSNNVIIVSSLWYIGFLILSVVGLLQEKVVRNEFLYK